MDIAVTGYSGAGSSGVLDLLGEYDCNSTGFDKNQDYEHVTLYMPGGLFDLEDKLLLNNDMFRSDEALITFKDVMNRLNTYNFGWFGSFQALFDDGFQNILDQFIIELQPVEVCADYYWQCRKVRFSILKVFLQFAAKILLGRTIYKWGRKYIFEPKTPYVYLSYPDEEQFYTVGKRFVKNYLNLFHDGVHRNTLYDRIVLISHISRVPLYFDNDFRLIVVRRDVRDIFVSNKYIWPTINVKPMYPTDVNDFIKVWKGINRNVHTIDDERIIYINFEDLIYKYEETVDKIEKLCKLSKEEHLHSKLNFNPKKSRNNTQVFRSNSEWENEVKIIESELSEYLYDFPTIESHDMREMFDKPHVQVRHTVFERHLLPIIEKLKR